MKKLLTFISLALCSLTAFANDYTDKLTVTVNGESMEQQATITITQQSDGKYTFSLNNFCLESVDDDGTVSRMGVGNIVLADREGTTQDGITSISYDDIITITEGDDPSIDFWMGPMIGAVPINMQARFNDTQLYCEIYIDLMSLLGQKIEVVFGTEPEPVVEEEVLTDPVITLNKDVENTIHIAVGTTSSTTHTATTYYTTNGSVPSATNGTAITEDTDVTLTLTCTVKAITISTSGMQSKMVSYNFGYVAPEEVSAPTIALKEGVENVVTITVGNTNHEDEIATTYYTTDGSMPSAENGTAITEDTDVTLSEDCTVQAITISSSGLQSAVALYRFTFVAPEEVSAPAISLKEGVENVITISVGKSSREAETATTYYTTDGSEPSATNGTAITEDTDVELTEDCTVKAITMSTSGMQIEVVSYDFTYIAPEVPEELTAPAITKKEGVRNTITISVGTTSRDTETATTYYTTDGSQPSATNGTAITEDTDVELTEDCTVNAITISTSGMQSEVVSYDFTYIAPEVPEELTAPAITKKDGVRNTITISVGKTSRDTETATTYYTTAGSQPSATNGTAITKDTEVELTEDCTVKAITISTSGMQSEVATYDFTFEQESGINMSTLNSSREAQTIYDLQGRKVTVTKRGGLYITNGKKAVIR